MVSEFLSGMTRTYLYWLLGTSVHKIHHFCERMSQVASTGVEFFNFV
jgi:hypothetical protein